MNLKPDKHNRSTYTANLDQFIAQNSSSLQKNGWINLIQNGMRDFSIFPKNFKLIVASRMNFFLFGAYKCFK